MLGRCSKQGLNGEVGKEYIRCTMLYNMRAHIDEAGIDVVRTWDSKHTSQTTVTLIICER